MTFRVLRIFTIISNRSNTLLLLLATLVEGDPKAPFSIATTPRFREEYNSLSTFSEPMYHHNYLKQANISSLATILKF